MIRKFAARIFATTLVGVLPLVPAATAFAAAPQQDVNTDLVGLWISEESEKGETVSISFFDDGSMQALSEFTDGSDDMLYRGEWQDNGDDTVSLLIEELDGESVGDEPVEVIFDVVSDSELNAADTTDFGDDGMTITFEDAEPIAFADEAGVASSDTLTDTTDITGTEELTGTEETTDTTAEAEAAIPGVYVTDELSDDDGTAVAALVYLAEDGSLQTVAATFDAESAPIVRLGSWEDDGEGTVTITSEQELTTTADGTEATDLDQPEVLTFTVSGDALTSDVLNLYRVGGVADAMSGFAGTVEEEAGAEEISSGEDVTDTTATGAGEMKMFMSPMDEIMAGTVNVLILVDDSTAAFTYTPADADAAVTEMGTWSADDAGVLTVELTHDENGEELAEPATITFEQDDSGALTSTDISTDRFGDSITLEPTEGE